MRVLWFSNTPPLGVKDSKGSMAGSSWIESLEYEMNKYQEVEIGIVFNQLAKAPLEMKSKTTRAKYFMVPSQPYSGFDRWLHRALATPLSQKSLPEYLRIIDAFQPDLILFFGTEPDFPLIIPKLKVPSVIWFQGNLTVYERMFENGVSLRSTFLREKIKDVVNGSTFFHNYLNFKRKVQREKKIFSFAKNFIGRTDWDRRIVNVLSPKANYFHCDEPMRKPFIENKWNQPIARDKYVIVTTVRENLYKGLETVFEASHQLNELLDRELEWHVIGVSPDTAYVKAALAKAKTSIAKSNVKLLGTKSGHELVQELLNADIYVHPSHIENSPNGVQEAMLVGMPVIATNVGGTPSMLINDFEGLLIQSKDPFAMAGAIQELLNSPKKAKRLGENARNRGIVRNNSEKICSSLLSIFNQLKEND